MKTIFRIKATVLSLGFLVGVLAEPAIAQVFPIATNQALIEFGGGVGFDGTNYYAGVVVGTNVAVQPLSATGQMIGSPVIVGANPGFPPAVAQASAKTNALVAWSDHSLSSGATAFGRLISAGGVLGPQFPLLASVGGHGFQAVEAAASDGTNFLVVWRDDASGSFYGQRVSGAGALSGSEFLLFTASGDGGRNTAVTFGQTNYLVAWQDGANDTNQTYCKLISPTAGVGSPVQVSTTFSLDKNPTAIGFDGTNYLVVWNRSTNYSSAGWPNWNLCGRFVSQSGATVGSELVLASEQAAFPAVAFDGDNYLLAWGFDTDTTNADVTIHARFLNRQANPVGPIFTPFAAQGTNPPLLPLNGVFFDGSRFVLSATFGAFVTDGLGDVIGFAGGDVYGAFLPRSMTPPLFTNGAVVSGQFQGQLHVVPGMTYTIETSTNLPDWTPVGTVSSDGTNLLELVDDRPMASPYRMFYRAVVGNTIGATYGLWFLEFANAGGFGGGFTPTPTFPVSLDSYSALFEVENELEFAAVTNVIFTGPAGSGLSNVAAAPDYSTIESDFAAYQSPFISSPAAAPGGEWVVSYKGTNINFTVADPQAASRLVIPLPTVSVSGDVLQSVDWVYKDATSGATLGGAPAYVTGIQVQVEGIVGGRIYESPELAPGVTSYALTSLVNWSNVSTMNMAYDDSLGNHYVVFFSRP